MSVTFTKLFSSITESTIWTEDDHTRLVWIAMLAMADRKGRVWGSIPGLANRARVPVESVERALEKFMSPDKFSRTKEYEGRRVIEIDGGWFLINYAKHRAVRDEEAILESKRKYINKRRAKERSDVEDDVEKVDRSSSLETQAEAELVYNTPSFEVEFDAFWQEYPRKVGKKDAKYAFKKNGCKALLPQILKSLKNQKQTIWADSEMRHIPHPTTWLNGQRWEDEVQPEEHKSCV